MFPVVVEVGEMAGGGGVAEMEIPVEVQALLYPPARPGSQEFFPLLVAGVIVSLACFYCNSPWHRHHTRFAQWTPLPFAQSPYVASTSTGGGESMGTPLETELPHHLLDQLLGALLDAVEIPGLLVQ